MSLVQSTTHLLILLALDGREVDIVFLDDTRVQRVEVHDHDVRVPQTTLWFEDKTSRVLGFAAGFGGGRVLAVLVVSARLFLVKR